MNLKIRKRQQECSFKYCIDILNEDSNEVQTIENVDTVELFGFKSYEDIIHETKMDFIKKLTNVKFENNEFTQEEAIIRYGYLLNIIHTIKMIIGD